MATCPPTWKEGAASLTGSTLPTRVIVVPMSARVTVAIAVPGRATADLGPGRDATSDNDGGHDQRRRRLLAGGLPDSSPTT